MNTRFVTTDTILDRILARKVEEIAERRLEMPLLEMRTRAESSVILTLDMLSALQKDKVALIAEIKRASPSAGVLVDDFAPVMMAATYAYNGAAAISVLTDEGFFQGSLRYLRAVRQAVEVPILRKDFIIDPYQVYEGRVAGADTILLIVAALSDVQLRDLHDLTIELGMSALVEVHNESEMARALQINSRLIGINNRDLGTFDVDLETTARLASMVNDDVVLVAESGIRNAQDVRTMGSYGADAILVGESLVKSIDIVAQVRELSRQSRGQDD